MAIALAIVWASWIVIGQWLGLRCLDWFRGGEHRLISPDCELYLSQFYNGFGLPAPRLVGVTIFVGFDPLTGYERGAVYL